MATLVVTLTASDGTTRQVTLPVIVTVPVMHGLYPGFFPGPTAFPGK